MFLIPALMLTSAPLALATTAPPGTVTEAMKKNDVLPSSTPDGISPPQPKTLIPKPGMGMCNGVPVPMSEQCPLVSKTPTTKPDGKCHISTNNMSNTCIFIIKKTVAKHDNTNTITPMPVVVNGMQLQLLNCTIMNNNQVFCNIAGLNNGAVLK